MRRIAATALAGGMLTVLGGTAAQANGEYYGWNSEGSPQTASGYGSTAKGYGQWRLSGSPAGPVAGRGGIVPGPAGFWPFPSD